MDLSRRICRLVVNAMSLQDADRVKNRSASESFVLSRVGNAAEVLVQQVEATVVIAIKGEAVFFFGSYQVSTALEFGGAKRDSLVFCLSLLPKL